MKNKINENNVLHIIALCSFGKGISGGDRIYIEFARRLCKKIRTKIYCWEEGYEMCSRNDLTKLKIDFVISKLTNYKNFGFLVMYLIRILEGIKIGLTFIPEKNKINYIYNASEFWMDSIPCIILKIRFPNIIWLASWYQTAPNPLVGFAVGQRESKYRFTAFLYWISQLPIKPFVSKFSDYVFVNNVDEKKYFPKHNLSNRAIVVLGAVDTQKIEYWKKRIGKTTQIYDAVFQGRFHAQKGVVELVDIWKKVIEIFPNARLAMIGDGPLMEDVKNKIQVLGLEGNIKLFGYVFDGLEKYKIFAQSKMVVHPAFFDSGGMASAEAMAFGLPCVGFDLVSYQSYYPEGMLKVNIGDKNAFSEKILYLLKKGNVRKKIGNLGMAGIYKYFSWNYRVRQVFKNII